MQYGCMCSFIVRVMVYPSNQSVKESIIFVAWSLAVQLGIRAVVDVTCCILESVGDRLPLANVWAKRRWGFVLFAVYMLFGAGLWLYVITFNVLTPRGATPLKYGIGWE